MNPVFKRTFLLALGATLAAGPLAAQGRRRVVRRQSSTTTTAPLRRTADSLKEATVAVYQTYQPELRPFVKPSLSPAVPPPDTAVVPQTYEVPQQALYYTYRALPLRPLALGRDTTVAEDDDYLRIGAGNRSTASFEGATTRLRGTDWQTVLYARHLSQHSRMTAQSASHTEAVLDGRFNTGGLQWQGRAEAARARYGRYGFNDETAFQNDEASKYWMAGVSLGLLEAPAFAGITYAPTIGIRSFSGPQVDGERSLLLTLPTRIALDSGLSLDVTLSGAFTVVPIDGRTRYNNAVSLAPALVLRRGAVDGRLGVTPTIGREGDFFLLPDLGLRYRVPSSKFAIQAGWKGTLNRNTLEELAGQNPYLTTYAPIQSRTYEVFGGLEANLGDHLSLSARGSWWQWKNLPLFVNDYNSGDGRGFSLDREPDARGLSLQGAAQYIVSDVLSIGGSATFFSFYQTTESRLWHVPAVQLRGEVSARPVEALTLNASVGILDQIYSRDAAGTEVKLNSILDLGGRAEYRFLPRWSVWAQAANLLDFRNERYLGYPAFGRTFWGGLRVKF